jgi:hypothetical protein
VIVFKWRRVPESNRCTRICNPLRHHSANSPFPGLNRGTWCPATQSATPSISVPFCSQGAKRQLGAKINGLLGRCVLTNKPGGMGAMLAHFTGVCSDGFTLVIGPKTLGSGGVAGRRYAPGHGPIPVPICCTAAEPPLTDHIISPWDQTWGGTSGLGRRCAGLPALLHGARCWRLR